MYITNIQRFSMDDGPGIRTTIFLAGCNMRCRWCHNPENLEMVMRRKEILKDGETKIFENSKNMPLQDVLCVIEKDKRFYKKTEGGITVSGGESALQADDLEKLLIECKKMGINTAMETALNYDYKIIQQLAPYIDLFLVDCKAVTNDVHIKCTGVSNKKILDNICRMTREKINFCIRIPVIPDINITKTEIERMAEFLGAINMKYIELLPYHKMGIDKYRKWDIEYTLDEVEVPTNDFMKMCKNALRKTCSNVRIQGELDEQL